MNSAERISDASQVGSQPARNAVRSQDAKLLRQTAEEYVAIENKLAAQRDPVAPAPQFKSIFDQLRSQMTR